jgi:flagellar biosynthesis protein FlhF
MIIKTYAAESAAAALKMVRAELGSDAVVLKTRELTSTHGGNRIEITACADKVIATEPQRTVTAPKPATRQVVRASFPNVDSGRVTAATPSPAAAPIRPSVPVTIEPTAPVDNERLNTLEKKLDRILSLLATQQTSAPQRQLREMLVDRDLPEEFINELTLATVDGKTSVRTHLTDSLTSMMRPGLTFKAGDSIAVLGFAGSGKTSTLGKLAARLVFQEKQTIRLVTLDSMKIGAFEELSSYADILGSPAVDFSTAKSTSESQGLTLIDTPALPRQDSQLVTLREQLDALNPTYRLAVISALTRSTDTEEIMKQLAIFAPTHLVVSMLDLTDRWGSAIAATRSSKLPICYITNAPAGIGTVVTPDAAAFTKMLLTEESNA